MTMPADYDLIVVGGGIHGVLLTYEAARRGLRPLLLEAAEFGGATSANSLGVLHGGFRYLQTADIKRYRSSVRERRWFSRHLPQLVRTLPCIMPLYGSGLRRSAILRPALALNNLLSLDRNDGVVAEHELPPSRLLGRTELAMLFPAVRRPGLQAAALWYDAFMPNPAAVIAALVHASRSLGATLLSQHAVRSLLREGGSVLGVEAEDRAASRRIAFRAPVVINCAGPWSEQLAAALGSPVRLFAPALAFNLLLDRTPPAEAAVAVEPDGGGSTYFLVPFEGRTLAGTGHAPWRGDPDHPAPSEGQIARMLADLNASIPGFNLERSAVLQVLAGLVPARAVGDDQPTTRDVFENHAFSGGPRGLYSSVPVKYTTARHTAEQVLRSIYGRTLSDPESPGELTAIATSHEAA